MMSQEYCRSTTPTPRNNPDGLRPLSIQLCLGNQAPSRPPPAPRRPAPSPPRSVAARLETVEGFGTTGVTKGEKEQEFDVQFNELVSEEFKIRKRLRYEQENLSARLYANFGYRFQQLFSTFAAQLKLAATVMRKKPKTCDTKNTDKYCVKETRAPPNEVRKSGSTPKSQKEFTDATPIPDHSGTLTAVEKSLSELKRILTLLTPTSSRSPTEEKRNERRAEELQTRRNPPAQEKWVARSSSMNDVARPKPRAQASEEERNHGDASNTAKGKVPERVRERGRRGGRAVQRRRAAAFFLEAIRSMVGYSSERTTSLKRRCPPRSAWGQCLAPTNEYNPFL